MSDLDGDFVLTETTAYLDRQIRLADQKASLLATGILAFVGLVGNVVLSDWSGGTVLFVVTTAATVLAAVALGCCGLVVWPRAQTTNAGGGPFFPRRIADYKGHIKYRDEIMKSDTDHEEELALTNYNLSKIVKKKYFYLRISIFTTALTLVAAAISVALSA